METIYLKRYYGQNLEANEDVADRNEDGLTRFRKTQDNWVVEFGWRVSRIEGAGDICLRTGPTEGCRADDDDALKQAKH
jgi:hypothetical protein